MNRTQQRDDLRYKNELIQGFKTQRCAVIRFIEIDACQTFQPMDVCGATEWCFDQLGVDTLDTLWPMDSPSTV